MSVIAQPMPKAFLQGGAASATPGTSTRSAPHSQEAPPAGPPWGSSSLPPHTIMRKCIGERWHPRNPQFQGPKAQHPRHVLPWTRIDPGRHWTTQWCLHQFCARTPPHPVDAPSMAHLALPIAGLAPLQRRPAALYADQRTNKPTPARGPRRLAAAASAGGPEGGGGRQAARSPQGLTLRPGSWQDALTIFKAVLAERMNPLVGLAPARFTVAERGSGGGGGGRAGEVLGFGQLRSLEEGRSVELASLTVLPEHRWAGGWVGGWADG